MEPLLDSHNAAVEVQHRRASWAYGRSLGSAPHQGVLVEAGAGDSTKSDGGLSKNGGRLQNSLG